MNKRILYSLGAFALGAAILGFSGLAMPVKAAETSYQTENVAHGKRVKFTDKVGQPINSEFLTEAHGPNTHGEGEWDPYAALTDGDNDPNPGHPIVSVFDGTAVVEAFAVLDLGQSYTITSFGLNFWHDHVFGQIVLQVSENENFSDAVTVYNNDTNNVMGQGVGHNGFLPNASNTTVKLATSPVQGRYVRVSGRSQNSGAVMFSELEVYAVTGGDAPVTGNLAYEYQSTDSSLTLSTVHSGATIYYTTDGSWPTASSTQYSAPIALSSVSGNKKLIRAVAIKEDGTATLPSDFSFSVLEFTNLEPNTSATLAGVDYTFNTFNAPGTPWSGDILKMATDGARQTDGIPSAYCTMPDGAKGGVWLYLDFGHEFGVNKVEVDFWHDWSFGAVIQLSTTADFTAETTKTVYSNYMFDSNPASWTDFTAAGATAEKTADTWFQYGQEFTFETVQARYFRVFCKEVTAATNGSVWSELAVYTPLGLNVAFGKIPMFDKYPEAERAATKMLDVNNFSVPYGSEPTDFADKLPTSFRVEDFLGNQGTITGTWASETYNKEQAGDYVFKFTPSEGNAFGDPYGVLNVTVTVAPAADKTGLKAAIERASALKQEEYLADHWQEFADALEAARAVDAKTLLFQEEADSAKTALENAMSVLIKKGDKTTLNSLLSTVNGLQENKYSKKSWAALQTAKAHATEVQQNDNATQSVVDLAVGELQTAYDALEELADKAALTQKVNELKSLDLSAYTAASRSALENVLADADELLKQEELYKKDADAVIARLDAAKNGLVRKADFSALESAVNEAKQLLKEAHTASTHAAFEKAAEDAQKVLDNDESSQEAIDAALAELNAKKAALVSSDKTELDALLSGCNYAQDGYTASSWNAYVEAKQAAQAISADEEAAQTEIDGAKTALQAAVDGLTELGDKTKLNAAIAEADAVTLPDGTSDEKTDFTNALEYAKSVAASNDVSQADVDEAENMLKTAKAALENAQKEPEGPSGGNETEKGCGGVVSAGALGVAALGALALVLRKKKENK